MRPQKPPHSTASVPSRGGARARSLKGTLNEDLRKRAVGKKKKKKKGPRRPLRAGTNPPCVRAFARTFPPRRLIFILHRREGREGSSRRKEGKSERTPRARSSVIKKSVHCTGKIFKPPLRCASAYTSCSALLYSIKWINDENAVVFFYIFLPTHPRSRRSRCPFCRPSLLGSKRIARWH